MAADRQNADRDRQVGGSLLSDRSRRPGAFLPHIRTGVRVDGGNEALKKIDLNADIGEGYPFDLELLKLVSSANICCGEHAGSWSETQRTAYACRQAGVRIGAHPGYPDRSSMGRAPGDRSHASSLLEQLDRFINGIRTSYIKPHGAFYNEATAKGFASNCLFVLVKRFHLPLMGLPGTLHETIAEAAGVPFIKEGFVDRRYGSDGLLVPRSQQGAVLIDRNEIVEQACRLAESVDSLCLHGDTPDCVSIAAEVRAELEARGWRIAP